VPNCVAERTDIVGRKSTVKQARSHPHAGAVVATATACLFCFVRTLVSTYSVGGARTTIQLAAPGEALCVEYLSYLDLPPHSFNAGRGAVTLPSFFRPKQCYAADLHRARQSSYCAMIKPWPGHVDALPRAGP
jgi:hypothetical protein